MSGRLAPVPFLVGLLAGAVIGWAAPATAHPAPGTSEWPYIWDDAAATDFLSNLWLGEVTVPVYIAGSGWTTSRQARTADAVNAWNAVGNPVQLSLYGRRDTLSYSTPCSQASFKANGLHWTYLDGTWPQSDGINTTGTTRRCLKSNGGMHSFQIGFDTGDPMSASASGPGSSSYDYQSLATHEFGHGLGAGHFADLTAICPAEPSSATQTMCPHSHEKGQTLLRSLEAHDIHTSRNAYSGV